MTVRQLAALALIGLLAPNACHRPAGERAASMEYSGLAASARRPAEPSSSDRMLRPAASARPPAEPSSSIVFGADQLGYLAPCGCSEHQLGGAARAAAYIEGVSHRAPTLFIQGGNLLFGRLQPTAEERPEAEAKATALAKSWQFGSAAATRELRFGPYDLPEGESFARGLLGPQLTVPKVVLLGGVRLGLLPLDGPTRGGAELLRKAGAEIVVAVVQTPKLTDAEAWAAASGADLALQSGLLDPVADTDEAALLSGRVPTFRVKDKGRGLLRLEIHRPAKLSAPGIVVPEPQPLRLARAADLDRVLASDRARLDGARGPMRALLEKKIGELSARRAALEAPAPRPAERIWVDFQFVELGDGLPEDPAVKALFDRYTAGVAAANLAAQGAKSCPAPAPGQLHYVGVASCRDCHPDPARVYDGMAHAHAYQTLVDKGRQYDLECIGCHVVGYGKPGGVCRLDRVDGLANVQCESCHGMGSAHADSAGGEAVPVPKPGIAQCLACHTPDNDTRFSKESYVSYYLPRILGPGHGLPLKR